MSKPNIKEIEIDVKEIISDLKMLLHYLKRGSCWCEVGIDNPMYKGEHTNGCLQAQKIVDKLKKI